MRERDFLGPKKALLICSNLTVSEKGGYYGSDERGGAIGPWTIASPSKRRKDT